jgi:hypothetical protein
MQQRIDARVPGGGEERERAVTEQFLQGIESMRDNLWALSVQTLVHRYGRGGLDMLIPPTRSLTETSDVWQELDVGLSRLGLDIPWPEHIRRAPAELLPSMLDLLIEGAAARRHRVTEPDLVYLFVALKLLPAASTPTQVAALVERVGDRITQARKRLKNADK